MKRNWTRNIIGGLSFTSALFIFQACYGTPQDFGIDLLIQGEVKSKTTGLPIQGIKVSVAENSQHDMTNEEGEFNFYTEAFEQLTIRFEDVDQAEHGSFTDKDSVVQTAMDNVYLEMVLEEK